MKDIEPELPNIEENSSFNYTPWSKYNSNQNCLGLPCRELLLGDVCIPLSNARETTTHNEIVTTKTQDKKT
jgi:hypothetical protein